MSEELNLLLEQFEESEIVFNKSRQIYKELENILIKKDYLLNQDSLLSHSAELRPQDTTSSCQNLVKNNSTHKLKAHCSGNNIIVKRSKHSITPDNKNCFLTLQSKIHQFESYQNSVNQARNKYASEFLSLLETENEKLSTECFESTSDSS